MPPKPVRPAVAEGIKYTPSPWDGQKDRETGVFCVRAREVESGKMLWTRVIYRIRYAPDLERDVQWVFITEIQAKGGKLLVTNELSEKFEMNLSTGRVRALTPLHPGHELPATVATR